MIFKDNRVVGEAIIKWIPETDEIVCIVIIEVVKSLYKIQINGEGL